MPIHLSDGELEQVKELAETFFTPKEIAVILEIKDPAFIAECNNENTIIGKAFLGGRLLSEYNVRKSILKLATSGSSPAQNMSMELIRQSKMKMIER